MTDAIPQKKRRGRPPGLLNRTSSARGVDGLTVARRRFVHAYLVTLNAAEAAKSAKLSCPQVQGYMLLRDPRVAVAILNGMDNMGMTAWVKTAIAEVVNGDIADFDRLCRGQETAEQARERGVNTRLIRRMKPGRGKGVEVELYDRLSALHELADLYSMLTQRVEVKGTVNVTFTQMLSEYEKTKRRINANG